MLSLGDILQCQLPQLLLGEGVPDEVFVTKLAKARNLAPFEVRPP